MFIITITLIVTFLVNIAQSNFLCLALLYSQFIEN